MNINHNSIEVLPNEIFYQLLDFLSLKDARKAFSNLNRRFDGLLDAQHSSKSVSLSVQDLKTCLDGIGRGGYSPIGTEKHSSPNNISILVSEMHSDDRMRQLHELENVIKQLPKTQSDKSGKTIIVKIPAFLNAPDAHFESKIEAIGRLIQAKGFNFKCEVVFSQSEIKNVSHVNTLTELLNKTHPTIKYTLNSKSEIKINDRHEATTVPPESLQGLFEFIASNGIDNVVFGSENQLVVDALMDSKIKSFRLQRPFSTANCLLITSEENGGRKVKLEEAFCKGLPGDEQLTTYAFWHPKVTNVDLVPFDGRSETRFAERLSGYSNYINPQIKVNVLKDSEVTRIECNSGPGRPKGIW